MKRVIIIVLDSAGCGTCPDSYLYGDEGANTLNHIARDYLELKLPNMVSLGLGHIPDLDNIKPAPEPLGAYGRMQELSAGKDTTTGHWELAGIRLEQAFPVFPNAFPSELIEEFEQLIGRKTIGNEVASGTEIIARLGDEHVKTGFPIVYTSADSVFQIAAHESIIPIEEQYEICLAARQLLQGQYAVGRVIARPFAGVSGSYQRTSRRHDYSLEPLGETLLDRVKAGGLDVRAIGKIHDIFAGRGTTVKIPSASNAEGIKLTIEQLQQDFSGLLFVNLVDFDMLYGHRNDVQGYAEALMEFDRGVPDIMAAMHSDDLLLITADHGCDPTYPGTDHTREYVPALYWSPSLLSSIDLGTISGFGSAAATAAQYLNLKYEDFGISLYDQLFPR